MSKVTEINIEKEVKAQFSQTDTDATREVMKDPGLWGNMISFIQNALEGATKLASGNTAGAIMKGVDNSTTLASMAADETNNKNLKLASNTTQILTQAASVASLSSNAGLGIALATLGAPAIKKMSLALDMVEDDKQAKMISAIADTAASILTFGVAAATANKGNVDSALLVGSALQLILTAYKAKKTVSGDSDTNS